ncbi:hypothetical protein CE131_12640 [Vibrio parahaemolyticus]|nr:hypothetical protein [Vibrio parahaemolyticus]OQS96086.1 hypothetical protein EM58_020050 [Vibrio parahaemolyticus 98-513-F52]EGQ8850464.1 hypothetical protein [Vibrio parahaemolyticus]EGQ8854655.1 hypothetical protein [Vibrio parahaemolyticus]EGQ8873901.1 hypothetical protein [Vibrio parahaemolyticus]
MLAITQGGVEYNDLIVHVCFLPGFCTFVQVNRLLPVFRYKKTRIFMRVSKKLVWLFFFHSLPARTGHDQEEAKQDRKMS